MTVDSPEPPFYGGRVDKQVKRLSIFDDLTCADGTTEVMLSIARGRGYRAFGPFTRRAPIAPDGMFVGETE